MNFSESTKYLTSLGNEVLTMKLGLENITTLLEALGDPQANYLKVQVAGTNGKGSVCAFLDSICREARIKTGLFTSPHLISITERIKIGGVDVSEEVFADLATRVRDTSEKLVASGKLETVPTFFEQVTAMALLAFADAKVKLAILETGLGGRYDATTAAKAEITAITRIDLDHQEYLGETIEEIAAEKAAIINSHTKHVVLGEQWPAVMQLLRKRCEKLSLEPINDEYAPWRVLGKGDGTAKVVLTLYQLPPITLGLRGRHQIENAQIAVQIARALWYEGLLMKFEDSEEEFRILEGLKNARHPGRLEYKGKYFFDGAHNIGGAKVLREYLDEFVHYPVTMIFGAMKDKNVAEIAGILFPIAENMLLTRPDNARAMSANDIAAASAGLFDPNRCFMTDSVADALAKAEEIAGEDSIILITGSLYLVGEAKRLLANS
jgi:dihydrofolate synthase / folylpolyglutamate synthase